MHAPARAQEFEKVVIALARLGRFPVDLVERALVDEGTDMVLVLARAAGCSWATAKELLQMQAAGRRLTEIDLAQAHKRYTGFSVDVARSIFDFYRQRIKDEAEAQKAREKQAEKAEAAKKPALKSSAGAKPRARPDGKAAQSSANGRQRTAALNMAVRTRLTA